MLYFSYFPLIAIIVVIYNALAFGGQVFGSVDPNAMDTELAKTLFQITMVSKETWKVTVSDLMLLAGLGLLFQEILRSASPDKSAIVNHGLSMALFVVVLVEFLIFKGFATSTFFLLMCMTLFDVVAGFTISILAARRDIDVSSSGGLHLQ
jgi:hypothetical protein